MELFKKIFRTASADSVGGNPDIPQPLAIEGIPTAPITPEPDEAELAAQALLESLAEEVREKRKWRMARRKKGKASRESRSNPSNQNTQSNPSTPKDAAYYQRLAERIKQAHRASALRATRFVTACEWQLKDKHLPFYGEGSLGMLEAELYKRIDIIEREGGELKRRWQHCLAEVTVRLMDAPTDPPPTPPVKGGE